MSDSFSWQRVFAMLLRHWYSAIRSFDRMVDAFYWVTIDLILWGITAGFMQQHSDSGLNVFSMITSSVILWSVVYRSQMDIGIGLLDELWNKNLINIFGSPLRPREWIASLLVYSVIKSIIAVLFGSVVAYGLYQFPLYSTLGWHLIPFFFVLVMSGWWIGLCIVSLLLRYTTKIQASAWTVVWLLAPLSAIYFPISSLPTWAQALSKIIPASYVFEEMRKVIQNGPINWMNLVYATILNLIYIPISLLLVRLSFKRLLNKGLAKIY